MQSNERLLLWTWRRLEYYMYMFLVALRFIKRLQLDGYRIVCNKKNKKPDKCLLLNATKLDCFCQLFPNINSGISFIYQCKCHILNFQFIGWVFMKKITTCQWNINTKRANSKIEIGLIRSLRIFKFAVFWASYWSPYMLSRTGIARHSGVQ